MRIERVGSTSVPGLVAKPIIDMLLVVPDAGDEPSYVRPLTAAGYQVRIREPDWFAHRMLKGPGGNINLHVQHYADAKTAVIEAIIASATA